MVSHSHRLGHFDVFRFCSVDGVEMSLDDFEKTAQETTKAVTNSATKYALGLK